VVSPTKPPLPPEISPRAHRAVSRLIKPVQAFLQIQAASGIVLIAATVVALIAANSSWRDEYHALWQQPVGVAFGDWRLDAPLHVWINDGLMTVFFFVVGLEIRRELHDGSLSQPRQAVLPLAAAVGGMVVPALIYFAFNHGRAGAAGWGVPMATDIAFAVGVLMLLGSRVPGSLRVFLLALAVIDDLGSILVIAIVYSAGGDSAGFVVASAGIVGLAVTKLVGARSPWAYVPAGVTIWVGLHLAGVEPALAGVICGLVTPVRAWYGAEGFVADVGPRIAIATQLDRATFLAELDAIDQARREAVPPADYLIHRLHAVVAFVIMPMFALANAGVTVAGIDLGGDATWVLIGIVVARVAGKLIGIAGAALLARKSGIATWAAGLTGRGVALVGMVGGIGFTVPLFVAQLVFPPGALRDTATLGLLIGSGASAVLGLAYGGFGLRPIPQAAVAEP